MAQQYFAVLTEIGEAKVANAAALGTKLQLTHMGVGDGGGTTPIPDRKQKALVHENRRALLNLLDIDAANPSQIIAEQIIPEDVGGWWIREMGLYDKDGNLCAVCNCPDTYKPVMSSGSGKVQKLRMILIVSSASSVELKIDPSIVLASRDYVDQALTVHAKAANPHPQYLSTEEGEVIANALSGKAPIAGVNTAFHIGVAEHAEDALQLGQFTSSPLSFRNLLVNGAQRIAQQYGNAIQTPANATWVIDQWIYGSNQVGKFSYQQVTGPTAMGFDFYSKLTVASAYIPASSDFFQYLQLVEAQNVTALAWGTPNAKPVSLQFIVNSSVAGIFSGSIRNSGSTRSYPFVFTVSATNTDTLIQIQNIPGDTVGSWVLTGTSAGIALNFDMGCGSTYRGAAGSWQNAGYLGATGAVSLVSTAGATFSVTGVQLEVGPICTPFERPTPEAEMARCQRYLPGITSSVIADVLLGGMVYTSVQSNYLFRFTTPSRVPVTGLVSSPATSFGVQIPNGAVAPSAISLSSSGSTTARIAASVSGLTPGQASELYATVAGAKLLLTGAQL